MYTTIAITSNTSWYLYNFRKNTIIALINKGYKVVAISPYDDYSNKLISLGVVYIDIDIDNGGTNPFRDLKTLFSFYAIFSKTNVDVVLNFTPKNNIYSTMAAFMNGAKVINNVAGLGVLFINEGIASKIARTLYKFSQKFANKIFFQNEDDRNLFLENGMASQSITDRLPGSGVDLSRFEVMQPKDDGKVRFLLIARMLYDKGVQHYVEAARILKKQYGDTVEFRLLGFLDVDNPSAVTKDEMDKWTSEGVVSYLGTSDQVEVEIAQVDCVVLPSFYREGVPKSLLEAGAMGKIIVTTDNVGCRETVDHDVNGYICEPRSTVSLKVMLEKVINLTYEDRIKMGKKSREKMENKFDEKIVIQKYLSAIDELI
ncbi:glycosyltransferase family 4 protein [Vibrio furnissii]|uniref:glycosyltransferase family 4 protein n=1 Tax=Vibrio furnissii TaxID=29494 RepID=UPI001559A970|nr:glycosyltransferase family 4 protein [Vibrio furnissii]